MPKSVQVDGVGLVEFSDDFTEDEILSQVDNIYAREEMGRVPTGQGWIRAAEAGEAVAGTLADPIWNIVRGVSAGATLMGMQGADEPIVNVDAGTLRRSIQQSPFLSKTALGPLSETIAPEIVQSVSQATTPVNMATLPVLGGGGTAAKVGVAAFSSEAAAALPGAIQDAASAPTGERKQKIADAIVLGTMAALPFAPSAMGAVRNAAGRVGDIPASVDLLRTQRPDLASVDASVKRGMSPISPETVALAPEASKAYAELSSPAEAVTITPSRTESGTPGPALPPDATGSAPRTSAVPSAGEPTLGVPNADQVKVPTRVAADEPTGPIREVAEGAPGQPEAPAAPGPQAEVAPAESPLPKDLKVKLKDFDARDADTGKKLRGSVPARDLESMLKSRKGIYSRLLDCLGAP